MVIAVRRAMVPKSVQMELQDLHVPRNLNASAIIASKTNAQTVMWKMLVEAPVIARMISVSRASVPMEPRVLHAQQLLNVRLDYVVTMENVMIYVRMARMVAHAE
jgi:hypothetical protein